VAGVAVILAALSVLLGIRRRRWLTRMRAELPRDRLVAGAQGVAAAVAAGAQMMVRLAIVGIRRTARLGTAAAPVLVAAVLGLAAATRAGARLILYGAFVTAGALSSGSTSLTRSIWRRRGALAWYLAGALFATMSALALTAWA
jgi:hypothetical protein